MPDPMLLIGGENLKDASFSTGTPSVTVERTKFSDNGHYAFVWLHHSGSEPVRLNLRIKTPGGEAEFPFAFERRKPESAGFQGFSSKDVMYLIMPDRFADGDPSNDSSPSYPAPDDRSQPHAYHGGDIRGVERHLDYLGDLGITAVWLTPIYNNEGPRPGDTYHGYSATDVYSVDPHLGTVADYQHLAQALHARGMKLVMDTVPNHMGPQHPWIDDEPTPTWFHGTKADHPKFSDAFPNITDPHATVLSTLRPLQGWFADILPDMNQEDPLASQYLIQNAIWWIETAGLDGLRIDTFPYVGRAFWRDFHQQIHSLFPRVTTVGEVFNGDPTVVAYWAGGATHDGIDTGLYTPFDFPVMFTINNVLLHGDPMTSLPQSLRLDWLYPHPERLVPFIGNHDTKRFMSQPGATIPKLKMAFALLATLRGMPQIYSGDEIAMQGGDDPDNRRDFPGGWPGDPQNAFTAEGRTPDQAEVHDWLTALLKLRAGSPALNSGKQQDLYADQNAFVFARIAGVQSMLIYANNSDSQSTVTVSLNQTDLSGKMQFKCLLGCDQTTNAQKNEVQLALPAHQVAIYSVQ